MLEPTEPGHDAEDDRDYDDHAACVGPDSSPGVEQPDRPTPFEHASPARVRRAFGAAYAPFVNAFVPPRPRSGGHLIAPRSLSVNRESASVKVDVCAGFAQLVAVRNVLLESH